MRRFVEGVDREQTTLFPECLEDWIDEGNPVRARSTPLLRNSTSRAWGSMGSLPRRRGGLHIIPLGC